MEKADLEKLLRQVKNFREELREKGNSDYDRVSNKDVLFFFLTKFESLNERITKTETKQKMFMWLLPILIAIVLAVGRI